MKAFWYDDKRKNVCGLRIRQLRKEQKITQKKLVIMAQLAGYDFIIARRHSGNIFLDFLISIFSF